jgi:short subunit fatty acids transporter
MTFDSIHQIILIGISTGLTIGFIAWGFGCVISAFVNITKDCV